MPDITMCFGSRCDLKKKCYRFMAIPSEWQSYCDFSTPDSTGEPSCYNGTDFNFFLEIGTKKIKK